MQAPQGGDGPAAAGREAATITKIASLDRWSIDRANAYNVRSAMAIRVL
jgi:hypothetical protein